MKILHELVSNQIEDEGELKLGNLQQEGGTVMEDREE